MKTFQMKTAGLIAIVIVACLCSSALFAQRTEIAEKRTLFSKSYRNSDNSISLEIGLAPVNYRDQNDQFQPINRNLVASASGYDFEVTQGLYHAYFNRDLTRENPIAFETKDGASIKMRFIGMAYYDGGKEYQIIESIQKTEPIVLGAQIIYPEVCKGVDLKYTYLETRLKEEIRFSQEARKNLPGPASYKMKDNNTYLMFVHQLDLSSTPEMYAQNDKIKKSGFEGDEQINFKNLKGDVQFFMPMDWAFLANDRDSLGENKMLRLHKKLIVDGSQHFLLSGVMLKNLNEMKSGDIIFDPQFVLNLQPNGTYGKDALIYFKNNYSYHTYNYGVYEWLRAGRTTYGSYDRTRSLLQFDLSALPDAVTIEQAKLSLFCIAAFSSQSTVLNVHKVLVYWDEGSYSGSSGYVNWITRSSANWGTPGGLAGSDYDSTVASTITKSGNNEDQWFEWILTDLVQNWADTPGGNNGLIVKYRDDHTAVTGGSQKYFRFYSSDNVIEGYRPKLEITYSTSMQTTYYIRGVDGSVISIYKK